MAEFPDDVLSIIRAYAKPAFAWFKDFKEATALNLCADHLRKLRTKMGDPAVREQLKLCLNAYADHKQSCDILVQKRNPMNEERESKKDWWSLVCLDNLLALLDDREFHEKTYAEWTFQEDSDSDTESDGSYFRHKDEWADLNYEDEWWHLQELEAIYPEIRLLFGV